MLELVHDGDVGKIGQTVDHPEFAEFGGVLGFEELRQQRQGEVLHRSGVDLGGLGGRPAQLDRIDPHAVRDLEGMPHLMGQGRDVFPGAGAVAVSESLLGVVEVGRESTRYLVGPVHRVDQAFFPHVPEAAAEMRVEAIEEPLGILDLAVDLDGMGSERKPRVVKHVPGLDRFSTQKRSLLLAESGKDGDHVLFDLRAEALDLLGTVIDPLHLLVANGDEVLFFQVEGDLVAALQKFGIEPLQLAAMGEGPLIHGFPGRLPFGFGRLFEEGQRLRKGHFLSYRSRLHVPSLRFVAKAARREARKDIEQGKRAIRNPFQDFKRRNSSSNQAGTEAS